MSQGFQPIEMTNTDLDITFSGIAATGAKIVRLDLPWQQIQPSGPSSYSFGNTLRVYQSAIAHGLTVLPVSSGIPSWAGNVVPSSPSSYQNFLYQAGLQLIPLGITAVEVANEANLTGMSPTQYTQSVLIPGSSGLRAAAAALGKTITVVSTGLAPAKSNGHDWSQLDFLKGIYAAGGGPYFDAVGDHPYTWPDNPGVTTGYNWLQKAADLRSLMVSKGDSGKQIWATEFGYPTNQGARGITESQQASYLAKGASMWSSYSWGGPLIFYSYEDLTSLDSDPEHNFGVVRSDGSAKPGLAAISQIMRAG